MYDTTASIFKATSSLGRLRVYSLWNRRAHDGRPVRVCAQSVRAALLPPGFSSPGLLGASPDRHFDPLHIFYISRLTASRTCDSLLWWCFSGHIVVGDRRGAPTGKGKRKSLAMGKCRQLQKMKNSGNELNKYFKTNHIAILSAANYARFACNFAQITAWKEQKRQKLRKRSQACELYGGTGRMKNSRLHGWWIGLMISGVALTFRACPEPSEGSAPPRAPACRPEDRRCEL